MRSTSQSVICSTITIFDPVMQQLASLATLTENWDSYGAPVPNSKSLEAAQRIMSGLRRELILPARILPSAEGGVAFTFLTKNDNRAVIETLNTGEEFVLLYDINGHSLTLDWPSNSEDKVLERLKLHLRGQGLAPS
jgi:hypothetical protein